jgi:co-chaperonin GroES (HSP10)
MNLLKHYVVKVNRSKENTLKVGDTELFLDTRFNEYEHITQEGVVVAVPEKHNCIIDDLRIDDLVYFHHFTCLDENDVSADFGGEKEYYRCEPINIYARKRGDDLKSFHDIVLCDFIEESEDNIKTKSGIYLKPAADKAFRKAIVTHCPKEYDFVGKQIYYQYNHDYEMTIDGKRKYRMYVKSVLAIISESGEYIPAPGKYVVESYGKDNTKLVCGVELFIPDVAQTDDGRKSKFELGKIIRAGIDTEIEEGSEIMFRNHLRKVHSFQEGDKKYFILNQEDIELVLENSN